MLESSNVKEKYKTYLASHKITFNKKIFESDGDAGPAGYKQNKEVLENNTRLKKYRKYNGNRTLS